jgi:hypothetical protein
LTTKAAELEPMVPAVTAVPSPQSIVAVKSAGVAAGLSSVKVATPPLNADPSGAVNGTGLGVITVAAACPTAATRRTRTTIAVRAAAPAACSLASADRPSIKPSSEGRIEVLRRTLA